MSLHTQARPLHAEFVPFAQVLYGLLQVAVELLDVIQVHVVGVLGRLWECLDGHFELLEVARQLPNVLQRAAAVGFVAFKIFVVSKLAWHGYLLGESDYQWCSPSATDNCRDYHAFRKCFSGNGLGVAA
jgi:hypothetical protein